jgi:hypothetical protein
LCYSWEFAGESWNLENLRRKPSVEMLLFARQITACSLDLANNHRNSSKAEVNVILAVTYASAKRSLPVVRPTPAVVAPIEHLVRVGNKSSYTLIVNKEQMIFPRVQTNGQSSMSI